MGFSLILSILFSSFRLESILKRRLTLIVSLILGGLLSIYSSIIRSIPNYINKTNFAFWCMVPVVVSLFLLGILSLLEQRLKTKHSSLYETLSAVFVGLYTTSTIFYYLPLLITGTSKFVNYGESPISTLVLFRVIGYSLGLIVVFLTSLTVSKTLSLLSKIELRIVVALSLSIFGITQIAIIFLRLYFFKILPSNALLFSTITFALNNTNLFIYVILLFISMMPILLWKKNIKIIEQYNNKAELRKLKAIKRNARRWAKASLFFLLIVFLSLSVLRYHIGKEIPLSPPENYVIENGMAIIPLQELEDDKLHRYQYISEDKISMRFIAIKKSEGAYGIGLDACDICGPSGYFERNGEVVCKLCDVVMNKATIGFPGGCNPVPLPYILHDGKIKIKLEDLERESYRFK
ncbi:MAG: Fe-S-containing protein [Treponema sp.]